MHSQNLSKYDENDDADSLYGSNVPRPNLKIRIENTTTTAAAANENESDVAMLDEDTVDEITNEKTTKIEVNDVSDISDIDDEYGLEVEAPDNEIEFHVKLDKPPPSLIVRVIF